MRKSYTWEYQIAMPPYDRLVEVVEAFFSSYPGGEYTCERRDRYRLLFRRGLWRRAWLGLGELIPDRLVKGRFHLWPVVVCVLARPAPDQYMLTVRYELHLPSGIRELGPNIQTSVARHIERELGDLAEYLARCAQLAEPPAVVGV